MNAVAGQPQARAVRERASGVRLVKNIAIPMRDGGRLAADLYVPPGDGPWDAPESAYPVVMDYYPYRKDDVVPGMWWYERLASAGYVCARVDVRGTGASPGRAEDEYSAQEQSDGYDAIEWLAAQPWCDGHVNLIGVSYAGFNAIHLAAMAPPHLTSIIPINFSDDLYSDSDHYKGGLWRQYIDVGWYGSYMLGLNALPPYSEWSGTDWAEIWTEHLENEPWLFNWLSHQTDGEFWRRVSVRYAPERVRCPAFLIGGWRDGFPNPPLRLYSLLSCPKKLLIGPWNHNLPDEAVPGPRIDYLHEVIRWLDHWCRGADNGIMDEPPIAVYMQRADPEGVNRLDTRGEWRAERELPPPGSSDRVLYFAADGRLTDEAQGEGTSSFTYRADVGVTGGLFSGGIPFGLPSDQRPDEAFSCTFTSEPLAKDVHILGRPRVTLHASSSAPVAAFVVSLSEVEPDGTSHLVAKGVLNATRRNSLEDPEPLEPGAVYELAIEVDTTGWIFSAGNRIRVSVAGSDWPEFWPTPYSCVNQIHHGRQRPSRLELPVIPAVSKEPPPQFRPSSKTLLRHTERVREHTWQATRDLITGRSIVRIHYTREGRVDEQTAWEREHEMVAEVHPERPESAIARGRHTFRVRRPAQIIEAASQTIVEGATDAMNVSATLEVSVNGSRVASRSWLRSFPRTLL